MNKVMIVVTHLLGSGHLARAQLLAQAFKGAGRAVLLVSGGKPVAHLSVSGVDLVQLPPLSSDGTNFSRLLTPEGTEADAAYLAARQAALLAALNQFRPDCLITELFPFGRRILRAEFRALLSAARALEPRPCILASVRDILAPPSKPERAVETEATIADFYDGVLVHSDPDQIPLSASWPVTPALEARLHYTGFIAPPPVEPKPGLPGTGEIIVSAGGGDVGAALYEAAIAAAAQRPDLRWRLLIGGGRAAAESVRLKAMLGADAKVVIEPARPEFREMLCHAAASVSLCGYNTALDLLSAGTPGVFVPFDAGDEVEQYIRARRLAMNPHFTLVRNAELGPASLLAALDRVMKAGRFVPDLTNLNGATRSVEIAETLFRAH